MFVFILLGALIVIYALKNFSKAFILYIGFRLFLNQNLNFDLPGLPLLSLDFVILSILFVFYRLKRNKLELDNTRFPLLKGIYMLAVAGIICSLFSLGGFVKTFPPTLLSIYEMFFVYLIWKIVTRENVLFLLWVLFAVCIVICCYAFVEKSISANPLYTYELLLAGDRGSDMQYDVLSDPRGYRVLSVFFHPIGAGFNFVLLGVLFIYSSYFIKVRKKYLFLLMSLALFTCSVFCNSRSPFVYFIALFPMILKIRFRIGTFLLVFIVSFFILPFILEDQYVDMVMSIFDINNKSGFVGSDMNMRHSQFQAAWKIFIDYPITGLGIRGYELYPNQFIRAQLLGLESIWIILMVEKGFIGLYAFIYFQISVLTIKTSSFRKLCIFFLAIAYLGVLSATSIPGAFVYLHYLTIIIVIKSRKWNAKRESFALYSPGNSSPSI